MPSPYHYNAGKPRKLMTVWVAIACVNVLASSAATAATAPSIASTSNGGVEVTLAAGKKDALFSLVGQPEVDIMAMGRISTPSPNSEQAVVTRKVLLDVRDAIMADIQEITSIVEASADLPTKVEQLFSDFEFMKSAQDELKDLRQTVLDGERDRKDLRSLVETLVSTVDAVVDAQSSGKDGCGALETPEGAEVVGEGSAMHSVRVFRCKLGFSSGSETWVCDASGKWLGHPLLCTTITSTATTMTTTTPRTIDPLRIDFGHYKLSVQKGWVGAGFNDGSGNKKGEWPRGNGGWQSVANGVSVKMTGPLASAGRSVRFGYTAATKGPYKDCEVLGSTKFVGGLVKENSGADISTVLFKGLPPNAKLHVRSWHFGTYNTLGKDIHASRFRVRWGDQKWSSSMTSPEDPESPDPPTTYATTVTVTADGELEMDMEAVEPYPNPNKTPKINLNGIEIQSLPFNEKLVSSCQL